MSSPSGVSGQSLRRTHSSRSTSRQRTQRTRVRLASTSSTSSTRSIMSTCRRSWVMRTSSGCPAPASTHRRSPSASPTSGSMSSSPCHTYRVSPRRSIVSYPIYHIYRKVWQDHPPAQVGLQASQWPEDEEGGAAARHLRPVHRQQEEAGPKVDGTADRRPGHADPPDQRSATSEG